jgi:hypothetical protein
MTMAREYDLNEPLSPMALFEAAQRRAHQNAGPAPLYRSPAHGIRFWLLRCTIAIALCILGWLAWSAAITPVRVSTSNLAGILVSMLECARGSS